MWTLANNQHMTFLALLLAQRRAFNFFSGRRLYCVRFSPVSSVSVDLSRCFLLSLANEQRSIWTNFYLVNYFRARCVYRYRDVVDVYIVYLFLLAISIGSDLVSFDNFILAFMNYPEKKNVVVFIVE